MSDDTKIKSISRFLDKKRVYILVLELWLTGNKKFLCKAPRNIFIHGSKKRRRHDTDLNCSNIKHPSHLPFRTNLHSLRLILAESLPGKDTIEFTSCTSNRINNEKNSCNWKALSSDACSDGRFWQVRNWIFVTHDYVVQLLSYHIAFFFREWILGRFWSGQRRWTHVTMPLLLLTLSFRSSTSSKVHRCSSPNFAVF